MHGQFLDECPYFPVPAFGISVRIVRRRMCICVYVYAYVHASGQVVFVFLFDRFLGTFIHTIA
jgi:hypothetical protein